jgi:carboxymethylenebutenolidase
MPNCTLNLPMTRSTVPPMPDIAFPIAEGSDVPGYLAVPEGSGPWPGVIVIQDVLGMTADLRRITDRFAASGYLTLTPALYGSRRPKIVCMITTMRGHFTGRGPAWGTVIAAREHLMADTQCTSRVGVAGFCMGAGYCLQLAPSGLFDAAAPCYASLPKEVDGLRRSCPVVASFGAKDPIVARGAAAKLEAVLADGQVPRDIKEYPHVGHSFMNDHPIPAPIRLVTDIAGLAYSKPEAEDAWQRIIAFFDEHLRFDGDRKLCGPP